MLDRRFEELLDFGEGDDLVELAVNLRLPHAEEGPAQVDVFAPGQFGMEAGTDLEERADASTNLDPAFSRFGDSGQDLQQGALSGAVRADDAENLSPRDFEGDVPQGPNVIDWKGSA